MSQWRRRCAISGSLMVIISVEDYWFLSVDIYGMLLNSYVVSFIADRKHYMIMNKRRRWWFLYDWWAYCGESYGEVNLCFCAICSSIMEQDPLARPLPATAPVIFSIMSLSKWTYLSLQKYFEHSQKYYCSVLNYEDPLVLPPCPVSIHVGGIQHIIQLQDPSALQDISFAIS